MSSEVSASYNLNFIMFVITAVYTIDVSLRVEFMIGLKWLCILIEKMPKTGTNNSKIEKKLHQASFMPSKIQIRAFRGYTPGKLRYPGIIYFTHYVF